MCKGNLFFADAATALSDHKERRILMAKKRSCRRTTDENVIHEKAVRTG